MLKILHIHSNIIFIDHSARYVDDRFYNEIAFIGANNADNTNKLNAYNIPFKIYENSKNGINAASQHANQFDGVVFHSLNETHVQVLYGINAKVKAILKFFGYELYNLKVDKFLSEKTKLLSPQKPEEKSLLTHIKRKIRFLINKDFVVKNDNQKKIYKKFAAILIVNKFEYDELKDLFYLPKLIERQFIDQIRDIAKCKIVPSKSNVIIVGNNGADINNHADILDIIRESNFSQKIEFKLFFSYGNKTEYSNKIKKIAKDLENINLIEDFLSMNEFERVYESASALVINSYRQNALGNIFMAIEVGCKIYLNKKCSTYKWLVSKGFLISEVEELKTDLPSGNYKLSIADQQKNIACFKRVLSEYPVSRFLDDIESALKN